MWFPTPVYERIPQFWVLLGLLFITGGLYLDFRFALSFWCIAVGFACSTYGAGVFLVRLSYRGSPRPVERTTARIE